MATPTSTSKKHIAFVGGPLGNQTVSAIPGIGPVTARHLKAQGIFYVSMIMK